MQIVIVGGGEIGLGLSRTLAPRHDVVVIDHAPAIVDRFANLDVQVLVGNGTNPDVLEQAGVPTCDFLIAATGVDEVNVLAALIARRLGSPKTICLTSRDDLLQPLGGRDLLREHVGVDRVVWPEGELAENIGRIVAVPGALDAMAFGVVDAVIQGLDGVAHDIALQVTPPGSLPAMRAKRFEVVQSRQISYEL